MDDDASSKDLEDLVADFEELDQENEGEAFRHYVASMMEDDKERLKQVIKGRFRDSIMKRTFEDKELEREMKVSL